MNKRRNFVAALGALSVLCAAPAATLAQTRRRLAARDVNLAHGYSKAKFEALLNQTFYIDSRDHGVLMITLIEVQPSLITGAAPNAPEQFSVTFRGLLLPPLPSGLYEISHLSAGRVSLYLSALPAQGSQPMYRADFSLLR